ncbi:MAG TPA: amidohydrolase, partial [Kineosporiaceae bacterium]|nr:amidohydrolase [Kineosporiaceae bacterium]
MTLPDDLATAQALVDQHCHGVLVRDLDRAGLEELISEGGAPAAGATNFDTPAGLAIRRHCAPVLDLPTHAPAEDYLARRTELGAVEAARRLISGSGTAVFCVDTGLTPDGLTTPDELARLGGGTAHEIVRLETVAEEVAAAGVEPGEFADRVADAVA